MKYRIAGQEDLEACSECVASTGYYDPIDFRRVGGIVLLAENDEGVQACVWAMGSGDLVHTDYLSVRPKFQGSGLGVRLLLRGLKVLQGLGVKKVRSMVSADNAVADKMNRKLAKMSGPYYLAEYNLEATNGN